MPTNTTTLEPRASVLLGLLEQFVNGALLEIERVERSKRILNADRQGQLAEQYKFPKAAHARLFLDTHFYFICVGQVNKCLGQLGQHLNNSGLKELHRSFGKEFEPEIRNDLEHLDERAVGKIRGKEADAEAVRAWMQDFGNFSGDNFKFGGKPYPVSRGAAKRLRQAYRQVIAVIREDYALKDAHFIEQEQRKVRTNRITRRVKAQLSLSSRPRGRG